MKKVFFLSLGMLCTILSFSQTTEEDGNTPIGPPRYIEKGDNVGVNVDTDGSGITTVTVVCACSESECFSVFVKDNSGDGEDVLDDCGGGVLKDAIETNQQGLKVNVSVDGNIIATGYIRNYTNTVTNGEALLRTNRIMLSQ